MNSKILISFNSQSINLGTFGFSVVLSLIFLQIFGYWSIIGGIAFIYFEITFLQHYEVFIDSHNFYLARYYYNEIEISKEEVVNFSEKKGYFNFIIYFLELKDGRKFKFIGAPKSLLEPNEFSIRQFLTELVRVNAEIK